MSFERRTMSTAKKKCKRTIKKIWCCVLLLSMLLLSLGGCSVTGVRTEFGKKGEETSLLPVTQEKPEVSAPPTGKLVALTFDDGPHNVRTKQIVQELDKYGAKATFFVLGNRIDGTEYNGKAGLLAAAESGHEIAIHGYSHRVYYNQCEDWEFEFELFETLSAIQDVIPNYDVKLMRPIGGAITPERVQACPYSVIQWSVDSNDWGNKYAPGDVEADWNRKVNTIVDNVMSKVEEGDIILMHDIYESTYDATVILLQRLYEEGYTVVTVSQLLAGQLQAGASYSKANGNP